MVAFATGAQTTVEVGAFILSLAAYLWVRRGPHRDQDDFIQRLSTPRPPQLEPGPTGREE